MKKIFVEPEVRKVELNFKERIASSDFYSDVLYFKMKQGIPGCQKIFVESNIEYKRLTQEEYGVVLSAGCVIDDAAASSYMNLS